MARTKYFNPTTGKWEYADKAYGSGGTITDEQIADAVEDYLQEHPIEVPASDRYYIATEDPDYPLVADAAADNTADMQNLINKVRDAGGGTIWLPIGEYGFDTTGKDNSDFPVCLTPASGVSIVGESLTKTIIKVYGHSNEGVAWMANKLTDFTPNQPNEEPPAELVGCTYSNFTVDMSMATIDKYSSTGKAFGMKGLKNCVFRDLRILQTPGTGLGIDMLDNVVIDSVYLYRCGREWSYGGQGGAGIGIGTGRWLNENFVIRNCICAGCGHFGIFLEDQGIFQAAPVLNRSMGATIANNVVRNGKHYGIGVRGGRNVVITGNNIFRNIGGIYLDYGVDNAMISNNVISENVDIGLLFGTEDIREGFNGFACEDVSVFGNSFFDNKVGLVVMREPINSKIENNVYIGNNADMTLEIPIDESKIMQDVYIDNYGEYITLAGNVLYDEFIDLDTTMVTWTPIGETATGALHNPRIAIYAEDKSFIWRINGDYKPDELRSELEAALTAHGGRTDYRYIKFGDNCNGEILSTLKLYAPVENTDSGVDNDEIADESYESLDGTLWGLNVSNNGVVAAFPKNVDIFILGGQSNCAGYGTPMLDTDVFPDGTYQYKPDGSIELVKTYPLIHAPADGKQIGFQHTFLDAYIADGMLGAGRRILLIPCACAGSGFADGRWAEGGSLHTAMLNRIAAVKELVRNNGTFKAVLWHQGESDVLEGNTPATYKQQLKTLIGNVWEITGEVPFIMGEWQQDWLATQGANGTAMAAVLTELANENENVYLVSSAGLSGDIDTGTIHFSAEAQREFGRRYYAAYAGKDSSARAVYDVLRLNARTGINGNTWVDESGNYNATLYNFNNSATSGPNQNGSLVFDNQDDYVSIPAEAFDLGNSDFTLQIICAIPPKEEAYHSLICQSVESTDSIRIYQAHDRLIVQVWFEDGTRAGGAVINNENCNSIAIVREGDDIRYYFNKEQFYSSKLTLTDDDPSNNADIGTKAIKKYLTPVILGRFGDNMHMDGEIRFVGVTKQALSSEQLNAVASEFINGY